MAIAGFHVRNVMLFSDRSIWTMAHGMGLGGAALLALVAALSSIVVLGRGNCWSAVTSRQGGSIGLLLTLAAALIWLAVLTGTYVVFPPYRVTPPPGATDLSAYPRSLVLANADTAWLHAFAMESKEHAPWIAAMLVTAVAFAWSRHRTRLLSDPALRKISMALLAISLVLVVFAALLGTFVNKVAPLY
jgi:hypothetical protein